MWHHATDQRQELVNYSGQANQPPSSVTRPQLITQPANSQSYFFNRNLEFELK